LKGEKGIVLIDVLSCLLLLLTPPYFPARVDRRAGGAAFFALAGAVFLAAGLALGAGLVACTGVVVFWEKE